MGIKRNVVLGLGLGALVVAGTLWAADARTSLPVIKADKQQQQSGDVGRTILTNIDHYDPSNPQARYHAKITDPAVPWHEKCQLAIQHGRLQYLRTDIGGTLGGTREYATSVLRVHLLCPDEIAVFDVPANFEVHTAPHPDQVGPMSFDTDMYAIEGKAENISFFSSFHLVGGSSNGFKSPGHTALIPAGENGDLAVESSFNVGYHVDFTGAKGGPLDGASGSVDGSILMTAVGK